MERSLYLATSLEFTRRLLILARRRHSNSPKRPVSMSDSFANGLVPRPLLDTLAMMREATLFFSLQNRSQCSLIQIVLPHCREVSMPFLPSITMSHLSPRVFGRARVYLGEGITTVFFAE